MPFRDDLDALAERAQELERELAELRAQLGARDARRLERRRDELALEQRGHPSLRATGDPDVRWLRISDPGRIMLLVVLAVAGIVAGGAGRVAMGLCLAGVAALLLQIESRRLVVNRRLRTFSVRWPWSPNAHRAMTPIDPDALRVVRVESNHYRRRSIRFRIMGGGEVLIELPSADEAERVAEELTAFLRSPPRLTRERASRRQGH
jgi:hypothetical protein